MRIEETEDGFYLRDRKDHYVAFMTSDDLDELYLSIRTHYGDVW